MKEGIKKTYQWIRKYLTWVFLVFLAFIVYILFFNKDYTIMKSYEYNRIIDSLKVEIKHAKDSIVYYKQLNENLKTDPEAMEKVVRENYHMQRPSEDVYIFEKEK